MDYKNAGVDIEAGLQVSGTYERAYKADYEAGSPDEYRRILRGFLHGGIQEYGEAYAGIRKQTASEQS